MIAKSLLAVIMGVALVSGSPGRAIDLGATIDSLFAMASAGEVMFKDMVEPAKDSIAAFGANAVPFLVEKFDTKSAREKWTVTQILKKIGSPAAPLLVRELNRPDGLMVQRICYSLGDIGDTAAVTGLIGVTGHPRWQVREQAVGALGKIGDWRARNVVLDALGDNIGQVRKAAAVAAGKIDIDDAVPRLVHRLGDEFYGARMSAVHALVRLDTTTVIATLTDSLDSAEPLVGDLGCRVLGEIGTDEAIELLLQQSRSTNPNRRAHAGCALVRADPKDNCGYYRFLILDEPDRLVRLKIESAHQIATDDN